MTSLGIVGLASFSVSRRTKQIGTRRALGASKADITRYFQSENLVISFIGVLLGAGLTIGLNIWMVDAFGLDSMDGVLIFPLPCWCFWWWGNWRSWGRRGVLLLFRRHWPRAASSAACR